MVILDETLDETLDENVFCQVGEENKPHLIGVLGSKERWCVSYG